MQNDETTVLRPSNLLERLGSSAWKTEELPIAGASSGRQRVALITGMVRNPEAFAKVINLCEDLRREELVERFVFSTWSSEREKIIQLCRRLSPATLVLSDSLPRVEFRGSPIHQARAWIAGLSVIRPDDIVLKFRTDRTSTPIVKGLAKQLATEGLRDPDLSGGYPRIFEKRPRVPYFNPNFPFLIHDIEFAILARDLATICNFDLTDLLFFKAPSTEGFFWGRPFRDSMDIVHHLLCIDSRMLSDDRSLREWQSVGARSRAWTWMQMLYFQIVLRYFDIGWKGSWNGDVSMFRNKTARPSLGELCRVGEPTYGLYPHSMFAGAVANSAVWLNHLPEICDTEGDAGYYLEALSALAKRFFQARELDVDFAEDALRLNQEFARILNANPHEAHYGLMRRPDEVVEL